MCWPFTIHPVRFGKHCDECRQLDFLAVACGGCKRWFCGMHSLSHELECADVVSHSGAGQASTGSVKSSTRTHGAAATSTSRGDDANSKKAKVKRCKKAGCRKPIGLVSHTCTRCALSFCMSHRFPSDHDCASQTTSPPGRTHAQNCAAQAARARIVSAPRRVTQHVF